jgi:hypothetical protein
MVDPEEAPCDEEELWRECLRLTQTITLVHARLRRCIVHRPARRRLEGRSEPIVVALTRAEEVIPV